MPYSSGMTEQTYFKAARFLLSGCENPVLFRQASPEEANCLPRESRGIRVVYGSPVMEKLLNSRLNTFDLSLSRKTQSGFAEA